MVIVVIILGIVAWLIIDEIKTNRELAEWKEKERKRKEDIREKIWRWARIF